ncbi:hypothetical protein [Neptunomonas antarctica]|uniref:Preprotein translocase subunit YajC n=1 Tax=Neptunomonas antarctica TaxID=619304 RepID=A0A1N7K1Z1_9GAMM|nr:hypothetical protein [Neptunomonas antarctica]SIS55581.1 hypothetical protein SAMN05421760_102144 [Neptunomonas antarctica]
MKIFIIVIVVMSLMGSFMWMMPTKREKIQAHLRLKAKKEGFLVQLVRLTAPRAEGEMEGEVKNTPAYRLPRSNLDKREVNAMVPWQIFRTKAIANQGLPADWSWKLGERTLSESKLSLLSEVINLLPSDVVALESTPVNVTAYWHERSGDEQLDVIKKALNLLIQGKI